MDGICSEGGTGLASRMRTEERLLEPLPSWRLTWPGGRRNVPGDQKQRLLRQRIFFLQRNDVAARGGTKLIRI